MSITSIETTAALPDGDSSYNSGFLDGELDAVSQLPADMHTVRASWGDLYDPMWAAGYTDGFSHATTLNGLNRQQVT